MSRRTTSASRGELRRPDLLTDNDDRSRSRLLVGESTHQRLDPGDRTEVRGRHFPVGNFDVEFGFDRKHEIDDVERGEAAGAEIIVRSYRWFDGALGEKPAHEESDALLGLRKVGVRMGTIKHGKSSPDLHAKRSLRRL